MTQIAVNSITAPAASIAHTRPNPVRYCRALASPRMHMPPATRPAVTMISRGKPSPIQQ